MLTDADLYLPRREDRRAPPRRTSLQTFSKSDSGAHKRRHTRRPRDARAREIAQTRASRTRLGPASSPTGEPDRGLPLWFLSEQMRSAAGCGRESGCCAWVDDQQAGPKAGMRPVGAQNGLSRCGGVSQRGESSSSGPTIASASTGGSSGNTSSPSTISTRGPNGAPPGV